MSFDDPQTLSLVIGGAVFLAIMAFRFSRIRKARRLRLEWLWVTPAILLVGAGALMWRMPPHGLEWLWLTLALAVGGAIGWQRGRMMTITVDPETHDLNQQASPAALIFLVALFVIRRALDQALHAEAQAWHLSAAFVTDVFVVFAVGLLLVMRAEMFIRARRLLDNARAVGKIVS